MCISSTVRGWSREAAFYGDGDKISSVYRPFLQFFPEITQYFLKFFYNTVWYHAETPI